MTGVHLLRWLALANFAFLIGDVLYNVLAGLLPMAR
jgi:hypothetical protein